MPENSSASPNVEATYRIGAVCRMTGLSSHVLRVWEKRYGVVEPERGPNRRRLYSEADVHKLSLLKSLVDRGHAIGSIAQLDTPTLEQRLAQSSTMSRPGASRARPSLALIGTGLERFAGICADSDIYDCVGQFDTEADYRATAKKKDAEVIVVEWNELYADSGVEAERLRSRLGARFLVLVYAYGAQLAIERLHNEHMAALRAPLEVAALDALIGWRFALAEPEPADDDMVSGVAPGRRFSERELGHFATLSTNVACECPRHLAQLIDSLIKFESYSAQCESRNRDDATLHAYLHRVTAQARARMETALERVIELEKLPRSPTA